MRRSLFSLAAAVLCITVAHPRANAESLRQTIEDNEWYLSIGLNRQDPVGISHLTERGRRGLYLRRFEAGGFWVDILPASGEIVGLREDTWYYSMEFSDDFGTLFRYGRFPMRYDRRNQDYSATQPYAGEWVVEGRQMRVDIRPLEEEHWEFLLIFPGDPLSGIRRGTYPFYRAAPGVFRSSQVYADSHLELTYEAESGSIKLTPLFSIPNIPPELLDPIRLWPRPEGS